MNPAPAPASPEQLRHLIPSPIPEGTLPGAPSPIDCQSYAMRGIITRRTALMDTLVRGRMKPEDQGQSADTARSLLELTAVLSHERAVNLPITPEGQVDPLDRAVNILMGSFTHPPVPNPDYSYALQIYDLLPDSEKPKDALEIQRMFTDDLTEVGEARRAGKSLTKDQKRKAAFSSLRMICLLGSPEHGLSEEEITALPSLMAGIIRDNRLGEEIGEVAGMKFGGEVEVLPTPSAKPADDLPPPETAPSDHEAVQKIKKDFARKFKDQMKKGFQIAGKLTPEMKKLFEETSLGGPKHNLEWLVGQIDDENNYLTVTGNEAVQICSVRIRNPDASQASQNPFLDVVFAVGPECTPTLISARDDAEEIVAGITARQAERSYNPLEDNDFNIFMALAEVSPCAANKRFTQFKEKYFYTGNFAGLSRSLSRYEEDFNDVINLQYQSDSHAAYWISESRDNAYAIQPDGRIFSAQKNVSMYNSFHLPSGDIVFSYHASLEPYMDGYIRFKPDQGFLDLGLNTSYGHYFAVGKNYGIMVDHGEKPLDDDIILHIMSQEGAVEATYHLPEGWAKGSNHYWFRDRDYASKNLFTSYLLEAKNATNTLEDGRVLPIEGNGKCFVGIIPNRYIGVDLQDQDISLFQNPDRSSTGRPSLSIMNRSGKITVFDFQPGGKHEAGMWVRREPAIYDHPSEELADADLADMILRDMSTNPQILQDYKISPESFTNPTAMRDHISSLLDLAGYFPRFMGLKEVGYMASLPPDQAMDELRREISKLDYYTQCRPQILHSLDRFITELKEMIPAVSGDVRKEYERRLKRLSDLHETVGKKGVGDANLAYHTFMASRRPF